MSRYAVASGNWSSTATWDGGTLPGVSDVVRPNGFTVSIDQNVTVSQLRNDASGPAALGGSFVPTVACTITADVGNYDIAGVTTFAPFVHENAVTVTINGNVIGGRRLIALLMRNAARSLTVTGNVGITGTTDAAGNGIRFDSTYQGGSITIGGNVTGGPAASTQGIFTSLAESGGSYNPALTYVPITISIGGDLISGTNVTGQAVSFDKSLVAMTVRGNIRGAGATCVLCSSNGNAPNGSTIVVYGNVLGNRDAAGTAINMTTQFTTNIVVYGNVSAGQGNGMSLTTGATTVLVHGSVTGGNMDVRYGIRNDSTSSISVLGAAVGGTHSGAHGIRNQSTGTVSVGGQSVANPSGALGVSNPGGGTVTTETLTVSQPSYLAQVTAGEGAKVLVTLLKNSVNAHALVTGTPTVDILNVARATVIGGAKNLTLGDEIYSYQHPTSVMTRGNLYYARVTATIDGVAQDLVERTFVAA